MHLHPFGERSARLDRVLITGGALAGKTTLASKFVSSPDKILYLSSDGNAASQGYYAITFDFPRDAKEMKPRFNQMLEIAKKHKNQFEAIALDLIEDYDERMQALLGGELTNPKTTLRAWGSVNIFYKHMHDVLTDAFGDKTLIFLSRDTEEYYEKDIPSKNIKKGDLKGYMPALRKKMKNIVLKDHAAELRCYVENGQRKVDIEFLRFEEKRAEIQNIINAKPVIPSTPPKPQPSQEEVNKAKTALEAESENGTEALKAFGATLSTDIKNAIGKEFMNTVLASAAEYDRQRQEAETKDGEAE